VDRRLKVWAKRRCRQLLELGQRVGLDVLPHDFYSPVPDLAALRTSVVWRRPYDMVGVRGADVDEQLAWLAEMCTPALVALAEGVYEEACRVNDEPVGYGPTEAVVLFCFTAARQPARVVQVGAGVSTAIVLRAAEEVALTAIDPSPTPYLRGAARAGAIALIDAPAQEAPLELFASLGDGDVLFVDSTHTVKPGSEVNRLVLDVLPRLAPGVLVHFHDVTWPYDYSPNVLSDDMRFWGESALLHAFLAGNERFALRASLSMLHHARRPELQRLLPSYRPARMSDGVMIAAGHFPAAAYLEALPPP
jgi:predicted O-methyltransferase YrrM